MEWSVGACRYVLCASCKSSDTLLDRDAGTRIMFLRCQQCSASRTVAPIKAGETDARPRFTLVRAQYWLVGWAVVKLYHLVATETVDVSTTLVLV